MEKKTHPDQKYIEGLLQNNSFIIQAIYDKFVPKVVNYIRNNSGDKDQAKDIVQEVLVVIYKQARDKDLRLTCPFDAYFFLLCKRRWLNELKKPSRKTVTIQEEKVYKNEAVDSLVFETETFGEREALFGEMFARLGKKCQELLQATFRLKTMEEVANKLGISYGYARKKKSLCIGKLTELIQGSPNFNKLKNRT